MNLENRIAQLEATVRQLQAELSRAVRTSPQGADLFRIVQATLTATLSAGGEAAATIDHLTRNEAITIKDVGLASGKSVASGKKVIALKVDNLKDDKGRAKWVLVLVKCADVAGG